MFQMIKCSTKYFLISFLSCLDTNISLLMTRLIDGTVFRLLYRYIYQINGIIFVQNLYCLNKMYLQSFNYSIHKNCVSSIGKSCKIGNKRLKYMNVFFIYHNILIIWFCILINIVLNILIQFKLFYGLLGRSTA
jgi:hypothetical protein